MKPLIKKIGVIGLGYVGLPLAVAFSKKYDVIGFDTNAQKIEELKAGIDRTREVSTNELAASSLAYTIDPQEIESCDFIIVAVPTPITEAKIPDLIPLLSASKTVGEHLRPGTTVVYESTVYPGATEEDCVPLLEKHSGLKCGTDFKVGYSPERINPGDKEHTLTKITKVVSGMDAASLELIAAVYESIIEAGVFRASSIPVAEAAKVIENTQRDLNIALMNELALIFEKMNIPTKDVLAAAGTKWNFLKFTPGLVGGHCIGVDPYYLTYKSMSLGYHPNMILAGRRINDGMGRLIAEKTIRQLIAAEKNIRKSRILVLGFTFKENVPDVRNTKVVDIINELREWGAEIDIFDPVADENDAQEEYQVQFISNPSPKSYQAVVLTVGHQVFLKQGFEMLIDYLDLESGEGVFIDVKSCFLPENIPANVLYWSL
ncbi:MAG: nucleotide sugar dehydrogenase [SAR324 cluster bacterium]|nr:nucleotide sugar dehydrogenase [SAR324 cluster bacterium]